MPDPQPLALTAARVAGAWGLDLGAPFAGSNYSYVAPAGPGAVLKVRAPDDVESQHEAEALELWGGGGAVRLLRQSPADRALLLERAMPGDDLAALPDERATTVAVEVAQRLWLPAGDPFRWIGELVGPWLDEAERAPGPGSELIGLARELYDSLDPGRGVLVHGDLHHHNLLDAGDRYVAIDPKPMLGEPEFDVPPFLWNPIGHELTDSGTRRRLAAFAAAGLDEGRMRAWAVIRAAYLGVVDEREAGILRGLVA